MNFVFTGSNNSKVFYSVRTKKSVHAHTHANAHTQSWGYWVQREHLQTGLLKFPFTGNSQQLNNLENWRCKYFAYSYNTVNPINDTLKHSWMSYAVNVRCSEWFFSELNFPYRAIYYLLHTGVMSQLYFEINNFTSVCLSSFINHISFVIQGKGK